MKAALAGIALVVALAVVVLNLLENDVFLDGSTAPPTEAINTAPPGWLPAAIEHDCAECGKCEHKLEIVRNQITLKVHDRDGWYRLLWAADDEYYYDEGAKFAAVLKNPTAHSPEGAWVIEGRYAAPKHDHSCGLETMIDLFELRFRLVTSTQQPYRADPFPTRVDWMSFRYEEEGAEAVVPFTWLLDLQGMNQAPCPCGKR